MIDLCHHSSIYLPRSQKNVARQNVIWPNVGFPVSAEGARLSGRSRCSGLLRLREERGPGGKLPALTKLRRLKNLRSTQKLSTPPFRLKTFFSEELFCKKREDWKKIHRPWKLDSAGKKKNPGSGTLCWLNNLSSSRGFSFSPGFVSGNELSQFFRSSSSVHSLAENEFRFFRDFRLFSNQRLNPIFLKLAFFRETCFEICQQCQQTIIF